jgi:glycosyltransferase involved in cell wall biosynthesis
MAFDANPQSRYRLDAPRQMAELVDRFSTLGDSHSGFMLAPGDPIVILTHALPPGGAERQWIYLARGLKAAGYDVTFVTYIELAGDNAHYLPLLKKSGIPLHAVRSRPPLTLAELLTSSSAFRYCVSSKIVPDPELLFSMTESLRLLQPKAIIAQLDYTNLFASLAALLAGVPRAVMSFRSYIPTHFDHIHKDWYRPAYTVLARSRRVLFSGICGAANREYADWIGLERGRVAYIGNAIDSDDFPVPSASVVEALRDELGLMQGQRVVLGVFRLSKEKNPTAFVDVCCRLIATYPNLCALIAGVGPLLPELQNLVQERGVSDNFRFLGRRSDVNVLMTLADLLLLTSDLEAVGNVITEAQLMGLPVVSTEAVRAGGALRAGVTGILCPIRDVGALHDACLLLLSDRALARRMSEAGRRHAATEFSVRLMAQRYCDLIAGRDPIPATPPRVISSRTDLGDAPDQNEKADHVRGELGQTRRARLRARARGAGGHRVTLRRRPPFRARLNG